jgi:putative ABC transport system ATP-binding protein
MSPTGNLDSKTSGQILALLRRCARGDGRTVVLVTHNPAAAATSDRVVILADGRIVGDEPTREALAGRSAQRPDGVSR